MSDYEPEDDLVLTPIHRSLIRNDLIAGCEKVPVIFLFATAIMMILIMQNPVSVVTGFVLVVMGFPVLKYLAKRDPHMYRVWSRHMSYQKSYECHPSLARRPFAQPDQQRKKNSTA